jgi:hypothetical protein
MKLTAHAVPWSSIVGCSIVLKDEKGAAYIQLGLMGGRVPTREHPFGRAEYEAVQARLVELINDEGLVIGEEVGDARAMKKALDNVDKFMAWAPPYMRAGLQRYVVQGMRPGSFWSAILSGDAKHARMMADANNRGLVDDYFSRCRQFLPPEAHGTAAAFEAWIAGGGLKGKLGNDPTLAVLDGGGDDGN